MASSTPATSLKVVLGWSLLTTLCLLRPNCITRPPPPCERFITQISTPAIRSTGSSTVTKVPSSWFGFCGSVLLGTSALSSCVWSSSAYSAVNAAQYLVPSCSSPTTF